MRTFTTVSDSSYAEKGIALYQSLMAVNENFVLYYLCIDDKMYEILTDINFQNLIPINLSDLEKSDKELREYKENNTHQHYCWCLGSYFTWHIMESEIPNNILYIDSDIYFYTDYETIYDEILSKSIGLITHRYTHNNPTKAGFYNVGIVYFNNDKAGNDCLTWWKEVVLDKTNQWFEEYGSVGDQRYLMLFEPLFGKENICVIDKTVGHSASWNLHRQTLDFDGKKIVWQGKEQDFVFHHFSHFQPNFEDSTWKAQYKDEWFPENAVYGMQLHEDYYNRLKNSNQIISNGTVN